MYIKRTPRWPDPRVKPPYGAVKVDWGHPLALGLVNGWLLNEGGGRPVDIVSPQYATTFNADANLKPAWQPSARGLSLYLTGSFPDTACVITTPAAEPAAGPISCFGYVYPTDDNYHNVMGRNGNSGWRYRMNSGRTVSILDRGGTNVLTTTATLALNTWASVGIAMGAGGLAIYLNGALSASTATAFGGGNGVGLAIGSLEAATPAETWKGNLDSQWKWARALSAGEFAQLHATPYIVCCPLIRRRYFVPQVVGRYPQRQILIGVGA